MKDPEIKELSLLYQNIIENNWNAIVFANMEGIIQFVNSAANTLYGYSGEELIGQSVDVFNSRETHNTEEIVASLHENGQWNGELIQKRKDDTKFDALLNVQVIENSQGIPIGLASNSKDISSYKETNRKLKQTVQDKEILIKEIHHRVKNNLSIVQGMLRLQRSLSKEISLDDFLTDFETRITVLSEAHNALNASVSSLQLIKLNDYLFKILDGIEILFAGLQERVNVHSNLEKLVITIDHAIPTALILNEVVTNCYKHAFKQTGGDLHVDLFSENNVFNLRVVDNGPGYDFSKAIQNNSLGLSLIDGLTDQLDGKYTFHSDDKGTTFHLKFHP